MPQREPEPDAGDDDRREDAGNDRFPASEDEVGDEDEDAVMPRARNAIPAIIKRFPIVTRYGFSPSRKRTRWWIDGAISSAVAQAMQMRVT